MFIDLAQIVAQVLNVKLTDEGAVTLSNYAELELRTIVEDAAKFDVIFLE
jgi:hypothetical protein